MIASPMSTSEILTELLKLDQPLEISTYFKIGTELDLNSEIESTVEYFTFGNQQPTELDELTRITIHLESLEIVHIGNQKYTKANCSASIRIGENSNIILNLTNLIMMLGYYNSSSYAQFTTFQIYNHARYAMIE
jgi:hypothetical protein